MYWGLIRCHLQFDHYISRQPNVIEDKATTYAQIYTYILNFQSFRCDTYIFHRRGRSIFLKQITSVLVPSLFFLRNFLKKAPTFSKLSPTFFEKAPTFFEKAPMFFEESPSFSRQPATFEGNLKMIRRESDELSGDFIPLTRNRKTWRKGNATNFSHNLKSAHFRVGYFHANIAGIARHISILAQRSILVLTQHSKKTQGALSAN